MSEEKVIKRRKRERKITEIETALRIGDLVALRKLAAEEYGLVEGMFSPLFIIRVVTGFQIVYGEPVGRSCFK